MFRECPNVTKTSIDLIEAVLYCQFTGSCFIATKFLKVFSLPTFSRLLSSLEINHGESDIGKVLD